MGGFALNTGLSTLPPEESITSGGLKITGPLTQNQHIFNDKMQSWYDAMDAGVPDANGPTVNGEGRTAALHNGGGLPKGYLQTSSCDRVLENLQFEKELLSKTNAEREEAIALREAHVDALSAEGQAIKGAVQELQQARQLKEVADGIGDSFASAFQHIVPEGGSTRISSQACCWNLTRKSS